MSKKFLARRLSLVPYAAFSLLTLFVLSASASRTAMVHLFEWKWNDVAKECSEFLGPHGYAAVQVSPPNEHASIYGSPWYQRYQPVSYKLESRSGSRDEFARMVKICKASGVDIYVDAVINHMTGVLPEGASETGSGGSRYSRFQYPTFSYRDFHHCGRNGDDSIQNYMDLWEVQNCQLVGLADLDTESPYVQGQIAAYLSDLVNLGVAGFRIDAAKHMASSSLEKILSQVHGGRPYVYSEVIDQDSSYYSQSYLGLGDVTEFKYGLGLGRIFKGGGSLAWLNGQHRFGEDWGFVPSDKAIVFLDNHDNQRGHGGGGNVLTHKDPASYKLAAVLMLAWPYGYPQVMSSYAFRDPSEGPPTLGGGGTRDVSCLNPSNAASAANGWVCEHRWPVIANMVKFRNATAWRFELTNWWTNGRNQIAFGRGSLGFVAINNEDSDMREELSTDLEPGRYCNVVWDEYASDECLGGVISVSPDHKVRVSLPPRSAMAIHVGRRAK